MNHSLRAAYGLHAHRQLALAQQHARAGRVGLDLSAVPGLGGAGVVDPGAQSGPTVGSTFTTQAQKDAAIAKDQANITQAQQSVDAVQAVIDGLRAQIVNVPGGVDENGKAVDSNFQGMVDTLVKGINDATVQLHTAQTVRNSWQAQLAQDQATPVTPQATPRPPAPQPPLPTPPIITPPPAPPAKSSWWKWGLGALAILAVGAAAVSATSEPSSRSSR